MDALDLKLAGRNFPPGETLGDRLRTLRRRQHVSQRMAARLAGVSQPAIIALERQGRGRLAMLNGLLIVLGAGATLMDKSEREKFYAGAGNSSAHHGWQTPTGLLDLLYQAFGIFDLDPCSPTRNRRLAPVRARVHFTMEDDGLSLPWHGKVFVNPPYGRTLSNWTLKARSEVALGNASLVVALVPARTDTRWWHEDVAGIATVFLLRGRLSFGDSRQSAPFPSALVIWGGAAAEIEATRALFPEAWFLPPLSRDSQNQPTPSPL